MAVWQVEFALVPRRALASRPRVPLARVLETDWWCADSLPVGYERHLTAIAPAGRSRTAELQTWGDEDGNRIDLWSENGKPARISVRIDVRRPDPTFGAKLLRFARTTDAVLVRGDGLVIEPSVGAFGAALRTSEAWRYASDPGAYLAFYSEDDEAE